MKIRRYVLGLNRQKSGKIIVTADAVQRVNGEFRSPSRSPFINAPRKVVKIVHGARFAREDIENAGRKAMATRRSDVKTG